MDKQDVVVQETRDFLQRIYDGSVGMMMSALVRQDDLSAEDIQGASGNLKGSRKKKKTQKKQKKKK